MTKLRTLALLGSVFLYSTHGYAMNYFSPEELEKHRRNQELFSQVPLINLDTYEMPRPIILTEEDIKKLRGDEGYDRLDINYILDLIYWDLIGNCYTQQDIINNQKTLSSLLEQSPDHRIWKIIYLTDSFDYFPGLIDSIEIYANDGIEIYANNGLATAQHMLGRLYKSGKGLKENSTLAQYYNKLAADQGFSWSQDALAVSLLSIDREPSTAAHFFKLAANQGLVSSKINLAKCYMDGRGVSKDPKKAKEILL